MTAPRFEIPLFFDGTATPYYSKITNIFSGSGHVPDETGLFLHHDINPSGSTLRVINSITDGNLISGSLVPSGSYSVGIDVGSTIQDTWVISLFDDGSAGRDIFWSGSHDAMSLYVSNDNSTWAQRRMYAPLIRERYSGSYSGYSGSVFTPTYAMHFAVAGNSRYYKLHCENGAIWSAYGKKLVYSEIRAYKGTPSVQVSGSVGEPRKTIYVPPGSTTVKKSYDPSYQTPLPLDVRS